MNEILTESGLISIQTRVEYARLKREKDANEKLLGDISERAKTVFTNAALKDALDKYGIKISSDLREIGEAPKGTMRDLLAVSVSEAQEIPPMGMFAPNFAMAIQKRNAPSVKDIIAAVAEICGDENAAKVAARAQEIASVLYVKMLLIK